MILFSAVAILHKPFDDIATVLEDIKVFNKHLHLCCLLTYGCLLRPHREVRELTWGDFSNDLSFITLSGFRNSRIERRRYAYGLDFDFSGINFKQCVSVFVFHNNF